MRSDNWTVPDDIIAGPKVRELYQKIGPSYRWLVIFTVMIGSFTTLLTGTIINVAIPSIMGAFGMGADQVQWVATGYLAATTSFMLVTAWAIEAFGHQATYITAMIVFLLGSLLGGLAMSSEQLILSRLIQGMAAGLVQPAAMLIIVQVFPLSRRGMAMGIFSIGVVLAPAMGPTVGGLLVDNLNWRYVFLIQLPLALATIPLAMLFLPTREASGPRTPFDWLGLILLSVFTASFLYGLTNGARFGWGSDKITMIFALALACGTSFVYWQSRTAHPLMDLSIFKVPAFTAAAVVTFVLGIGLFGSTYLIPLFLQTVMGVSPTQAGLLLMPAGLAMAAMNPVSGFLSDKTSPRLMIIIGLNVFAFSSFLYSGVDLNTGFVTLIWWTIIGRVGMSCIFPSLNAAALKALPFHQMGQGSGVINFLRQLGGAFGVNLLTILLQRRISFYSDAFMASQTASNIATQDTLASVKETLAQGGVAAAHQTPIAMQYLARTITYQASVLSYRDMFLMIVFIFFLTMIPAWFMGGKQEPQMPPPIPPTKPPEK